MDQLSSHGVKLPPPSTPPYRKKKLANVDGIEDLPAVAENLVKLSEESGHALVLMESIKEKLFTAVHSWEREKTKFAKEGREFKPKFVKASLEDGADEGGGSGAGGKAAELRRATMMQA